MTGSIAFQNGDIVGMDNYQISAAEPLTFDTLEDCQKSLIETTDNDWTIKKRNRAIWSFLNVGNSDEVFLSAQCVEVRLPE